MVKIPLPKGVPVCPFCGRIFIKNDRALSMHIRYGHSIEINNTRDQLREIGFSLKDLNKMNESQLAKEIQRLRSQGILK